MLFPLNTGNGRLPADQTGARGKSKFRTGEALSVYAEDINIEKPSQRMVFLNVGHPFFQSAAHEPGVLGLLKKKVCLRSGDRFVLFRMKQRIRRKAGKYLRKSFIKGI